MFFFSNPKRDRFLTALRKACWSIGPGQPCVLVISDDEFIDTFGDHYIDLSTHLGYPALKFEFWGTKVCVTCPKLSGRAVDFS